MAEAPALPAPLKLAVNELDWARDVVARYMPPTPQYEWAMPTEYAESRVTVKHENHTPVGAFKVRGGLVYFERPVAERPEVSGPR
jgi:threonine dehydratase